MGDGLGYRRWIYEEFGQRLIVLRDAKPHPDAVEVPDQWINDVARQPQAFTLAPHRHHQGKFEVVRRRRVRLSLSAAVFDADDKDVLEFMVIDEGGNEKLEGLPLPPLIDFTVNGQPFAVAPHTVWPLVTARPGLFIFALTDQRVWAEPSERRATAR